MNGTYIQFSPDEIFHKLEAAADAMADAEASAMRLEELKSVLLAQLMIGYKDGTAKLSMAEVEMRAKADPKYSVHIEGMCVARKVANRARARYKDLELLARLRQTQESSARSMVNTPSGGQR